MNWAEKVAAPQQVIARQVGDELVILDLASGIYFGLDPIGARIWQLLNAGKTPFEVRDAILEEYDVAVEKIEEDMVQLINELRSRGLLA